jgi:putative iron-regulated protein
MRIALTLLFGLFLLGSVTGCAPKDANIDNKGMLEPATDNLDIIEIEAISMQLWQHAGFTIEHSIATATHLKGQIELLINTPNTTTLAATKDLWHEAHNQFREAATLSSIGAINPGLFAQIKQSFVLLDQQPIQPGYLDYFDVYQHSGIVNDLTLEITATAIRQQHGFSDDTDVSLGYHAIAYLLWGEKQRPYTDFEVADTLTEEQKQNGMRLIDLPSHRRNTLLALQTQLLIDDLSAFHYKLTHPASGLYNAYQSLPVRSRLQLWQQAISHSLIQTAQSVYLKNAETSSDTTPHNQYAGLDLENTQATLMGLQKITAIANQATDRAQQFEQQLAELMSDLSMKIKQRAQLKSKQKQAIANQLEELAELMQPITI